ncbi:Transposon Tf2-9 polyprotein [Araneus ventricosus]|uniref:RNA-directed DNA polymerase n=1 Tax=Araneus ventricosus TaxID=182803 RepID=A0A4Y2VE79_ARAVE|nr:Transposon Tf2-9 polyprotein [Araneus ventricosus]
MLKKLPLGSTGVRPLILLLCAFDMQHTLSNSFQAFSLKDIVDLVKPFSSRENYSIETFISDVEDIFNLHEIKNPIHQVIFVKKCLTGPALTLMRSIRGITNWEQMKQHLLDEFSDKINGLQLHKLMESRRMKPFETLQEYFLAMRDLAHKGSLDDSSLIEYVINGIPDLSNNKIILYGCKSIPEFKEKLKIYEKLFNTSRTFRPNNDKKIDPTHAAKFDRKRIPNPQPICYSCGLKGHKSTQCTNKPHGKQCYGCKNFGHIHANCPQNSRNSASKSDPKLATPARTVNQISAPNVPQNLMHVDITLSGIELTALCDTGSQATIINEKTYLRIGSPPLYPSQITFSGIGRNTVQSIGFFQDSITVQNLTLPAKIHVLSDDTLPLDILIGIDFLQQTQFTFDKDGIRFCSNNDEYFLFHVANVIDDCPFDLSHVSDSNIRNELSSLINSYKPNKTQDSKLKMNIVLQDQIPVCQRARRLSFPEKQKVNEQITDWLNQGIIRETCSDYCSPLVLCKKKDGNLRLCIDYRKLNAKTVKDRYPLPLIEEVLDQLHSGKFFSTIDLKNGFFHVEMEEDSKKFTSFVTHDGQYEFNKVPFGLCNSPSIFQRFINHVFRDLLKEGIVIIYMDDIIIPSIDELDCLKRLSRVLQTASEYGLELNLKKCNFLKSKIEFLGYIIVNGKISPSLDKTVVVQNFPEPKSVKQVQSFLGLTGYFRKFIQNYALVAKPLSDLLRDNTEFHFGPEQKSAFQTLKQKLSENPVLHIFKQGAKLQLHTDASKFGYGAILFQQSDDNKFHPIHYMSKKTSPQEEKYSSYELEVLAIIEALKKFRNYLVGSKFRIITDCSAFQKTMSKTQLTPKIARWALFLEDFNYEIVHRPGKQMKHVDCLSRYPIMLVTHDEITSRIVNCQQSDEYISSIKQLLENKQINDFVLKNNVLYKIVNDSDLLVVPEALQNEIIKKVHTNGHFALAKTEQVLEQEFYIPNARTKIENVIANCVECILYNKKHGKGEGFLNPIPKDNVPLNTYHIDFVGPLPSTNKRYQHIFTVVDAFTKFTWFYPVKSPSAQEAIDKLKFQQTIFGNPSRIITDRGSAFTANEFETYCSEEGIQHLKITTGIPRGNGQIERMHRILIPVLSKLSHDDPTKWFKHVPTVQRVINSSTSRSTKYTPFELMMGTKMKNKEDIKVNEVLHEEYLNHLMHERDEMRNDAKKNILKVQEENRRNYDKKRKKAHQYKVGDFVAIQRTQFGTGLKLRPKFYGPYEVIKVKMKDRYDVKKLGQHEGPNITSTAADHMKMWSRIT